MLAALTLTLILPGAAMTTEAGPAKEPPWNPDAEASVLSGLMRSPELFHEISPPLKVSDFYRSDHQCVYQAILAVQSRGEPSYIPAVADQLERDGNFERIGGVLGFNRIIDDYSLSGHVLPGAGIVRSHALTRAVMEAAEGTLRDAYSRRYDCDQLLDRARQAVLEIDAPDESGGFISARQAAMEAMEEIENLQAGAAPGLSWGQPALDWATGGLQRGSLYVLAGRPSCGKTALALSVADHAAVELETPTLFFSLEMGHRLLTRRILSARARIDGHALTTAGKLGEDDRIMLGAAYDAMAGSKLHISMEQVQTPMQVVSAARRYRAKHGLGLVVLDYLQLLEGADEDGDNRQEKVAKSSRTLKNLAVDMDVPILILSQLNRAVESREDHRPRMSDLRESGAIEQDSDVILLIYRPDYYDPADQPGLCEINVAKNRNGPTERVNLRFVKSQTRFEPWDDGFQRFADAPRRDGPAAYDPYGEEL